MKAAGADMPLQRWPRLAKIALASGSLLVLFLGLALIPLPIPPYLDFQVLYQTNMGLLRGISPYDHVAQIKLIAQLAGVSPEQVYSLPFPYPPWYALSTVWLAWMPIEAAARVWFGISLTLLLSSVWLLTDGWPPVKRLLALGLAVFFLPVLGSLVVGQYVFPVLLGAALMTYACRREKELLVALAAVLLTFKPHLGGLIIVVVLIYLWRRGDAFGRRGIAYCAVAGIGLLLAGFLVDRAWPVSYFRSLLAYRGDEGVASCGLCASLPALIASQIPRWAGLGTALGISALLLVLLIGVWVWRGGPTLQEPLGIMLTSTLIVLLVSPYLLNYDFVLLLVPLAILAGQERKPADWILLAGAYALPFVALALWGRQGNFIFPLCAAILVILSYRQRRLLDVSLPTAYNG
jgi:hypothetical protein